MPAKRVSFKHRCEYALFVAVLSMVRFSPQRARAMLKKCALLWLRRSQRQRRVVEKNLHIAFPELAPPALQELLQRVVHHFINVLFDLLSLFANTQLPLAHEAVQISGAEHLTQALHKKRGVMLCTGHFGHWEMLPYVLQSRLQVHAWAVVRPIDNPLVETRVRAFRERLGAGIINKKGALRGILSRLKDNAVVILLMDQNTLPSDGVFVDFFGKRAATVPSLAQIHLKMDIPLVPVFFYRDNDGYRLEFQPEIQFSAGDNLNANIFQLTQQLTWLIERKIRQYPEQWFWFHNRWKTRPEGEAQCD